MNRSRFIAYLILAAAVLTTAGCHGAGKRRSIANEPVLSGLDAEDKAYLDAPATTTASSVVDRHPLLYKPREYWDTSGDNRVVKAAAATFIGVPAGMVGEVRQIFTGAPPAVVSTAPTVEVHR
ncbi:hypothetical protein [Paludisphaera rhizosphaerae]|uniref:hypothetical protein n=1 Tax=Paludisphaera rhizosphaerae TaxID=2711216 RepID=UPI0013E9C653|nr:hypothetical protein [Paludisphaera rhizosphaerae]